MRDSQMFLTRTTELRQRLEQAQGLAATVSSDDGGTGEAEAESLQRLQRQVEAGTQHTLLLNDTLRRLTENGEASPLPRQLTLLALRPLDLIRHFLGRLRAPADAL